MTHDPDGERWRCKVCRRYYPVTVLARDCEADHEHDDQPDGEGGD
jgi:hypothetical protein